MTEYELVCVLCDLHIRIEEKKGQVLEEILNQFNNKNRLRIRRQMMSITCPRCVGIMELEHKREDVIDTSR